MSAKRKSLPTKISMSRSSDLESSLRACYPSIPVDEDERLHVQRRIRGDHSPEPVADSDLEYDEDEVEVEAEAEGGNETEEEHSEESKRVNNNRSSSKRTAPVTAQKEVRNMLSILFRVFP